MDDDFDFESPQDEFYFLLGEVESEEVVETYCVQSEYVNCYLGQHKFKVHVRCWSEFELREECVVTSYTSQKKHLCFDAPFSGCAACGLNIYFIEVSNRCDICNLLQNV